MCVAISPYPDVHKGQSLTSSLQIYIAQNTIYLFSHYLAIHGIQMYPAKNSHHHHHQGQAVLLLLLLLLLLRG